MSQQLTAKHIFVCDTCKTKREVTFSIMRGDLWPMPQVPDGWTQSEDRDLCGRCVEAKPKRFLAFGFGQYYPAGGWDDYQGSADSVDAAKAILANDDPQKAGTRFNGWQVVDSETGQIVEKSE